MTSTEAAADFFNAFVAPARAPSPGESSSPSGPAPAGPPPGGEPPAATMPPVAARRRGRSRRAVLVAMVAIFAFTVAVTVLILQRGAEGSTGDGRWPSHVERVVGGRGS